MFFVISKLFWMVAAPSHWLGALVLACALCLVLGANLGSGLLGLLVNLNAPGSGRRVAFGRSGAPDAEMADAVGGATYRHTGRETVDKNGVTFDKQTGQPVLGDDAPHHLLVAGEQGLHRQQLAGGVIEHGRAGRHVQVEIRARLAVPRRPNWHDSRNSTTRSRSLSSG